MSASPFFRFTFFAKNNPLRNAVWIFLLTTLFYFIGAKLRLRCQSSGRLMA